MTRRRKSIAIALTGGVALASGAYALGNQAGDGSAGANSGTSSNAAATSPAANDPGLRPGPPGPPGRALGLEALASKLGVDADKLRTALGDIRNQLGPKGDPRDHLAAALADGLGIPKDKVTAALDKLHPKGPAGRPERFGPPGPPPGDGPRFRPGGPADGPPDAFVGDLAQALGVDRAQVTSVLRKLHTQHESQETAHRTAFEKALADRLGISQSKVQDALRSLGPPMHRGWRGR